MAEHTHTTTITGNNGTRGEERKRVDMLSFDFMKCCEEVRLSRRVFALLRRCPDPVLVHPVIDVTVVCQRAAGQHSA